MASPSDIGKSTSRELGSDLFPLRLFAARGGLGIELYRPIAEQPLSIVELAWALPGVRFPVDLSGGVRAFTNRRGRLTAITLRSSTTALARWLEPRVRHLLGGLHERPSVWLVDGGFGVGLWCAGGALAFDVLWTPDREQARLVISNPRGAGFEGPAIAQALLVADAAVGRVGERRGRRILLGNAIEKLLLRLLPELGVRVPSASDVMLGGLLHNADETELRCEAHAVAPELSAAVGSALLLSEMLDTADDALLSGDADAARAAYLAALEVAPRHPELCGVIAALDVAVLDRTEAALGLLTECLPVTEFGLTGAELLQRTGDPVGAEVAVSKLVSAEPFAPLAANAWLKLSRITDDPASRAGFLDRALAVSPRVREARWERLRLRLSTGDVNGALADAEHLEASAKGTVARHEVLTEAGRALLGHGFVAPAGRLFERALRYRPSDGSAALGLAEALIATDNERRALPLLERAAQDDDETTRSRACLVLAKLLATTYRDLPQAIAKAQRVSAAQSGDAIEARALEARWRAALGDTAGAALCYGRLHDTVQLRRGFDVSVAVTALLEAGAFAADTLSDLHAGHRYLQLALRLSPNDRRVQGAYRRVAGLLGPRSS